MNLETQQCPEKEFISSVFNFTPRNSNLNSLHIHGCCLQLLCTNRTISLGEQGDGTLICTHLSSPTPAGRSMHAATFSICAAAFLIWVGSVLDPCGSVLDPCNSAVDSRGSAVDLWPSVVDLIDGAIDVCGGSGVDLCGRAGVGRCGTAAMESICAARLQWS